MPLKLQRAQEAPGELVKTQSPGSQRFWFHWPVVRTENLHFQQASKWCCVRAAVPNSGLIKLVYFSLTLKKSLGRWSKVGTKMSECGFLLSLSCIKWHVISYSKMIAWVPAIKCTFEPVKNEEVGEDMSPLFLRTCVRYCTCYLHWHLLGT